MRLKAVSAKTDKGPYLELNEDHYAIDLTNNLFMMLDGFGGTGAGDVAVKQIAENMQKFYLKIAEDPDSTMPFFFSHRYLIEGNALVNAMLYTHKSLLKHNLPLEMTKRGGASAAFFSLSDNIATLSLVGNMFCYLIRNGRLIQIFNPDNFQLLTKDELFPSYVPTSAFGLFDDLYYQVKEVRPLLGDVFVLASDGALANLTQRELLTVASHREVDLDARINKILEMSNAKGNADNQSAMILEF
jgi:serine/threonine protein phosphatase PrpC